MLLMLCFVCVCLAAECAWDLLVAAVLRLARVFVLAMLVVYALQVWLYWIPICFIGFFLRTWMLFLWLESMILIMDLWRPFRLSGSCICLVSFTCWFPNLSRFQLLEVCFFSSSSFLLLLCFLRHWCIVLGDYFGWFCDVCLHMAWYYFGILLFCHFVFRLHFASASVRSFWSSIKVSSSLERLFWFLATHQSHHLVGLLTMPFMFV